MKILSGVLALLVAGSAMAEPVDGKTARKMLFPVNGSTIEVSEDLSAEDADLIAKVAKDQLYYGAIAYSPDQGILSDPLTGAFSFHDVAAAEVAALAECDRKRAEETTPCVIAATIRPRRWEARDVQLSQQATKGFRSEYRLAKPPKAMAISPATGEWSIRTGEAAKEAAIAACLDLTNGRGVEDCLIVVSD